VAIFTDLSGSGNHATQATGAKQPTFKASVVGKPTVRFDGSDDYLDLPNIALGAQSTFALVVKRATVANNAFVFASDGGSFTPALVSNFSSKAFHWWGNGGSDFIVLDAADVTTHVVVVTYVDGGQLTPYIDGVAGTPATPTGLLNGRKLKLLGCGQAPPTNLAATDVAAFLVWPSRALSAGEVARLSTYLAGRLAGTGKLIADGDSLTAGFGVGAGLDYVSQLQNRAGGRWASFVNLGVSAQTLSDMLADAVSDVDAKLDGSKSRNLVVCWGGTNDMFFGASGATAYGRLVSYCTGRRAAGFKVVVLTALPRNDAGVPADFATQRATFNTSIRSNWATFADALADIAADSRIGDDGDYADATYYNADQVHLTAARYALVAVLVRPGVESLS
jgi:lysophospholipase L1-like esterase